MALLWATMDSQLRQRPLLWRHNAMAVIVPWNTRGPERDNYQREFTAITGCQSIDNMLDINVICYIFLLNNSEYIIRRNCRVQAVFVVLNKCTSLGPSVTLPSRWHDWRAMRTGVNNYLLNRLIYYLNHHCCCFNLYVLLDKRNILWLRDMVRQTSLGKSAAGADLRSAWQPLSSLGMSAWPYRVTALYSYCITYNWTL